MVRAGNRTDRMGACAVSRYDHPTYWRRDGRNTEQLLVGLCPTCGSDDRLTRLRPVAPVDQRITDGLCSDDDWHWSS